MNDYFVINKYITIAFITYALNTKLLKLPQTLFLIFYMYQKANVSVGKAPLKSSSV